MLYNDVQKLNVDRLNYKSRIDRFDAKLYSYELKLDRMHNILKMKTYNDLLNMKRKQK